jgi:hypothetical protein
VKKSGTKAPIRRAFTGVWKRGETFASTCEAGVALSRAYEKSMRELAPKIDDPHEKNAKTTARSKMSLSAFE